MQSYFPERVYLINADKNPEEVFQEVLGIIIKKRMELKDLNITINQDLKWGNY
jgi:hypothetical protein